MFGPKREEVAGGWRGLHNEELRNLYASTNIITVIKSKRVRLAGYVARVECRDMHTKSLSLTLEGEEPLDRPRDM